MPTPTSSTPSAPTPEQEMGITIDLLNCAKKWVELGIDPDDFVKCSGCRQYWVDEHGNWVDCSCEKSPKA